MTFETAVFEGLAQTLRGEIKTPISRNRGEIGGKAREHVPIEPIEEIANSASTWGIGLTDGNGETSRYWKRGLINPEVVEELAHRTPSYTSWQGETWVACCGDYCAYIGPVGTEELEETGMADELFEADGSLDGWKDARRDMVRSGWFTGHLFRCLHCGRCHLRADVA